MNILAYCYEFPPVGGGAGQVLSSLANEWIKSGHQITVITSHFGDLPEKEDGGALKILRLKVGRKEIFRGRILEMFRYMNASTKLINEHYEAYKPDLCLAFLTIPSGMAPFMMKKKYGVPFICSLHGGDVPGFYPEDLGKFHLLTKNFIYGIWKESDAVVPISHGLGVYARESGLIQKIQVIVNGVNTDNFTPLEKTSHSPLKIAFAGRFKDSQKNISTLIQAVKKIENVELLLAGDGPDRKKYEALVKELNLESRVKFKGWLKENALRDLYREADVYVSASRWEGMPITVLEAMSCGLPLYLSDIPGHRELIQGNGEIFKTEEELIQKIEYLKKNPSLQDSYAKSSRQLAVNQFSWSTISKQYLDLMHVVLNSRHSEAKGRRISSFKN